MLGLDPLYVANEGKLIAIVEASAAREVLAAMRNHRHGRQAQMIGTVPAKNTGLVTMRTSLPNDTYRGHAYWRPISRICWATRYTRWVSPTPYWRRFGLKPHVILARMLAESQCVSANWLR